MFIKLNNVTYWNAATVSFDMQMFDTSVLIRFRSSYGEHVFTCASKYTVEVAAVKLAEAIRKVVKGSKPVELEELVKVIE